jgi:hypothetical protein
MMLVYTKARVAVPSFLFTVGTVTGVIVMLLCFLDLLAAFLPFCISLEHGLHEGHALITPRLLVGLLGLRGLTCCCLKGLTYHCCHSNGSPRCCRSGRDHCEPCNAGKTSHFLGTLPVGPPDALCFRLLLALDQAVPALPFASSFLLCFSTMTGLMTSRSGSNKQIDQGTVEWLRLYWFCHDIRTDACTIAARSASPKGIFPFIIVGTALGLSFNVGRCLTWLFSTPIHKICCCIVALWGLRTACRM